MYPALFVHTVCPICDCISAVLQTCCTAADGHIIKWIPSFHFPCCFYSFNHPFISLHLSSIYSHSCQMYILLPSQTRHNPPHSWLQAPNLAHQPAQHTHCSLRCRTGWAWPSHRTAGAWKPASTQIAHNSKNLLVWNMFFSSLTVRMLHQNEELLKGKRLVSLYRNNAFTCMVVLSTIMLSKVISG